MTPNVIAALAKERRELARKLEKIDALLVEYGEVATEEERTGREKIAIQKAAPEAMISPDDANNGDLSKGRRIKAAVVAFLNQYGPQHRKTILEHLEKRGLMGDEKEPLHRLAIYLSGMRDLVTSDGAGNFRLVRSRPKTNSA
ncbi:hypothetical protein [Methylovirgula sp. HY1]|uniref:hypothetical protein n=1 Tax=Methylovirgula sp. HY1 TaxID=2822761 RepID=UPI001C5B5759|nr:hypothetical protein [Methylovirgula sp. HY1]QXX73260.1 hypothetical protein MHY1_00055 [Methylovirgula sp. HY1]